MVEKCKRCGEYHGGKCRALAYRVWTKDATESAVRTIYALNKADAAEKFAAWYDERDGEYFFATVGAEVLVMQLPAGSAESFFIEGVMTPHYNVHRT